MRPACRRNASRSRSSRPETPWSVAREARRSMGTRPRYLVGVVPCLPQCRKFLWFNLASMRLSHPHSTTRSAGAWRLNGKRVFSSLEAATWHTTCTPMPGDAACKSHTTGRSRSRKGRENCSWEEYTPLVNYENQLGSEADLAVPTPEHYLPLLCVVGTRTLSRAHHISSRRCGRGISFNARGSCRLNSAVRLT